MSIGRPRRWLCLPAFWALWRLRQRPAGRQPPQNGVSSDGTNERGLAVQVVDRQGPTAAATTGDTDTADEPPRCRAPPGRDSGPCQLASAWRRRQARDSGGSRSADSPAGPPPAIPAELPPPPAGGVSISAVKAKDEEEKKKGFEFSDLRRRTSTRTSRNAAGHGPDEKIARRGDAGRAKRLFAARRSTRRRPAKFATAADRWPDSPLEEDALFLQGESEFFADQYPKAHDTFGGLLKKYANTRHLDTVFAREFAIGRYWEQLYNANPTWPTTPNLTDNSRPMFDAFGYAVQAYERVRIYDPRGPLADASLMALGNAYFRRGQFGRRGRQLRQLIKEYPNSKYQLKAHLFALQANMRVYQGAAYDETPLRKPGKLAEQTLTQFGDKLGDEAAARDQDQMRIEEERANRDFVRAQYYQGRHRYGAARLYYNSVIDEFPAPRVRRRRRRNWRRSATSPTSPPHSSIRSLEGRNGERHGSQ